MQLKCYLLGPIGPILQYQKVQRRVYPPIAKNFFCVEYKVLHLRELPHVRQHCVEGTADARIVRRLDRSACGASFRMVDDYRMPKILLMSAFVSLSTP